MVRIVYSSSRSLCFFESFLPGFLGSLVGFVELRPGCLPGQPGLGHQSPDVAFTVLNVEFLGEIVTRQWNRPRGRVISDFLRWVVECFNELFVLFVGEFSWSAFTWFVVDNSLERLSFEPFEAVEPLRSPPFGVAVEFCCVFLRNVVELFVRDCSHQTLRRSSFLDLFQHLTEMIS